MRTKRLFLILALLLGLSCSRKWDNPLESGENALNRAPSSPVNPSPANGASNQDTTLTLAWSCSDPDTGDTVRYDVYLGTMNPPSPAVASNLSASSLVVHNLNLSTTYYWRVTARDNHGATSQSSVWSFITGSTPNNPPYTPSNPSPPNGAAGQALNLTLSWNGGDPDPGDTARYDVYFDTVNPPLALVSQDQLPSSLVCNGLSPGTTYYWQILSRDQRGRQVNGPIWAFGTGSVPIGPLLLSPANGAYGVGISPTVFVWGHVTLFKAPVVPVIMPVPFPVAVSVTLASASLLGLGGSEVLNPAPYIEAVHSGPARKEVANEDGLSSPDRREPASLKPLVTSYQIQVAVDTGFGSRVVDQGGLADTTFSTNGLTLATMYYWRVRATNDYGTGPWSGRFAFMTNRPPNTPGSPSPSDGAMGQPTSLTLSWSGGDPDPGDTAKYDVFFDTVNPPVQQVSSNQLGTTLPRSGLAHNTTYYWKIVSRDLQGLVVQGPVWRFSTASYPWDSLAPMPTARGGFGAAEVGGLIYAIGGADASGNMDTVEMYDPGSNSWSRKRPMPTRRDGLAVVVLNNNIYAIGGNNGNLLTAVEEYNPVADTWATKAPLLSPRRALVAAVVNGKIYAIGGYGGPDSSLQEYDPVSNTWTIKAMMLTPRAHLAVAVVNNKIYAIGGTDGGNGIETEEYDPTSNTWASKRAMPTARYGLTADAVNGKIYCFGGVWGGSGDLAVVEAYDPSTDTWATKLSMPTPREWMGSAVYNGRIYVIGGTQFPLPLRTHERYDPGLDP